MEDRICYSEQMLAENPGNPTGLLWRTSMARLDAAAVLERYGATHGYERTARQHILQIRFRANLTEDVSRG